MADREQAAGAQPPKRSGAVGTAGQAGGGAMRFDLPTIEADSVEWWDAARDQRLLIRRCAACGAAHFYPRPFCPVCWSDQVSWEQASGQATLYTWSTIYRNDLPPFGGQVPYVAAVVELAEGPKMMTNVVDAAPDRLRVGMPLSVAFRALTDEVTIPVFAPA